MEEIDFVVFSVGIVLVKHKKNILELALPTVTLVRKIKHNIFEMLAMLERFVHDKK